MRWNACAERRITAAHDINSNRIPFTRPPTYWSWVSWLLLQMQFYCLYSMLICLRVVLILEVRAGCYRLRGELTHAFGRDLTSNYTYIIYCSVPALFMVIDPIKVNGLNPFKETMHTTNMNASAIMPFRYLWKKNVANLSLLCPSSWA